MKKILFITILFPVIIFGQKKVNTKVVNKKTIASTSKKEGYTINGDVEGYANGTSVGLFNGNTGAPEAETTIQNNKFSFKGKLDNPDFRVLLFNKVPPYLTLFIDNSNINIKGSKDKISDAIVTGSKSNSDFELFNKRLDPFKSLFEENAAYDEDAQNKACIILSDYVKDHKKSYITPLAILRFNQIADDYKRVEDLYNLLDPQVKSSPMGNYIAQQISQNKQSGIGTLLPNFTQADTSGKPISLTDFKGKYVLIDFWASWCGPCRAENPNVLATFNKFKDKNFTVLGISLDKAKDAWINAIYQDKLEWVHVSDLKGWGNEVAAKFQITSIPQNYLIDPTGKIIGKNLRGAALQRKLAKIIKG